MGLLFLALLASPVHAAASVKTSLDRDSVMVGESTGLSIAVEGATPTAAEKFPNIRGLNIQYRGVQQQTIIVNGQRSNKRTLTYLIVGVEPGDYTIPGINITTDAGTLKTDPARLRVTKNDVASTNRYAFLRLNVPRQEIFVGEVLPIELQLYFTQANDIKVPELGGDGFIVNKRAPHSQHQTQIGNVIYSVYSFKMSISAAKAGALALGPAQTSLDLLFRQQPDPNDPFAFFNRTVARPVTVASPAVAMNVSPLPSQNVPAGFSGAIGTFSWTVSANPVSVQAGDPITLRIAVSGQGNLDNLKLPEFTWPNFRSYPANSSVASDDPLGLTGVKTFEQVIVPQDASIREIPALSLPFFDPAQKKYVALTHPATPVQVRSTGALQAQPTVLAPKQNEPETPLQRTDIVHIKTDPGALVAFAPPLFQRPWFLLLQALPVLGFFAVLAWRRREDFLRANPRARRKTLVEKSIREGLVELRAAAAAGDPEKFFLLVFRLLQEQLGERLDLPATAITEAALEDPRVHQHGSPELIERVRHLLQACNQARYAQSIPEGELQKVLAETEWCLTQLQQFPD